MLAERLHTEELMDDPSLPADTYFAVVADLAQVNRVTMAYRPTLAFLAEALGSRTEFSVLDVGYGHGDMLRQIAKWAQANGKSAELAGVDLNPSSEPVARASNGSGTAINYLTGDYQSLAGERFDFIISSLVAHHMSQEQLIAFLQFMQNEAQIGWFINDLHRHGFSYLSYPLLARMMGWHPIVRQDGQTSIARSFRSEDWSALLAEARIDGARIHREFPFRLCVSQIR